MEAETKRQPQVADNGDRDAGHWLPGPGDVVASRFRVERLIGEGGMGAVVAAEHIETGGKVAIKFLHPHLTKDAESLERFIREAKVATQIRSEHTVRVLDVGKTPSGLPYIVMDLLEGADLGHVVLAGPMAIPLALDCVLQAAEALAEAHAQGVVHRDIKPANLWLSHRRDGSPCVRVLDFGISKLMPTDRDTAGITDTKASFGSPAYMSPEQIRSAKRVDQRTDVWALGVVLHELLSATLPFDADNVAGILAAIISDPPAALRRLRPDVPPEVEGVVRGMLEKDPARRLSLADFALGVRPFASAAGQIAADRILRMSGTPLISLVPPPVPMSSADLIALGKTEPSLQPSSVVAPRSGLVMGIGVGLAVAIVFGSIGVLAVQHRAQPQTTVTAVPSPSPLPPPSSTDPLPEAPSAAVPPVPAPAISFLPKPAVPVTVRRKPPAAPTAPTSSISEGRTW